jgi:hypothetical protein
VLLKRWVSAPKTPVQSIGRAMAELMLRAENKPILVRRNLLFTVTP